MKKHRLIHFSGGYGAMLTLLVIWIYSLITVQQEFIRYLLGLFFILGLSASAVAVTRRRSHRLLFPALGLAALVLRLLCRHHAAPLWLNVLDDGLWIGFTGALIVAVFLQVFHSVRTGARQVMGAVCVYLLIGLLFSLLYELLMLADPHAIYFDPGRFTGAPGTRELVYYSFVTLSTVGYGDVSPVSPQAQALSILESTVGVMYIAVLISLFVSRYGRELHQRHSDAGEPSTP